jgi:hypothetical protein
MVTILISSAQSLHVSGQITANVCVAEMRGDVSIARQTSAYNMEGKSKSRIHAAGKDRQDNVIRMKIVQCIQMLDSQQHPIAKESVLNMISGKIHSCSTDDVHKSVNTK